VEQLQHQVLETASLAQIRHLVPIPHLAVVVVVSITVWLVALVVVLLQAALLSSMAVLELQVKGTMVDREQVFQKLLVVVVVVLAQ
jgi:hypothetical protein